MNVVGVVVDTPFVTTVSVPPVEPIEAAALKPWDPSVRTPRTL